MSADPGTGVQALAAGRSARIGRYAYGPDGWTWTDALYAIHGFEPGDVRPSSELMISHQDPEDVAESREDFKQALVHGDPYCSYHHIIDAKKRRRTVLVAGRGTLDDAGNVVELHGYVVDLSDLAREDRQAEVEAAIAGVAEHRATIEQAKGILLLALNISADEAFEVLRAQSQDTNMKLNEVARRLVDAVEADDEAAEDETRARVLAALDDLTS